MAPFQIIIDGYNLLHAAGLAQKRYASGELERARNHLLSLLRKLLAAREQEQTLIVFDAEQRSPSLSDHALRAGRIRIYYSTQHGNADALIETLIEDHPTPRKLTVVSSDHRIQRSARLHQALFLDSESFLSDLVRRPAARKRNPPPPHPKHTGEMTTAEVEFWLREFSQIEIPSEVPLRPPSQEHHRDPSSLSDSPLPEPVGPTSLPTSAPRRRKTKPTPSPRFKAPGKGARRPLPEQGTNTPPIFTSEWIEQLQAWVDHRQHRRNPQDGKHP